MTKEQEKRFDGRFCTENSVQNGFIGDYQGVFFSSEDVKQHLADEIAKGIKGFSDFIVSELSQNPFTNNRTIKNAIGVMRNKYLKGLKDE